jgi:hypothetical protein
MCHPCAGGRSGMLNARSGCWTVRAQHPRIDRPVRLTCHVWPCLCRLRSLSCRMYNHACCFDDSLRRFVRRSSLISRRNFSSLALSLSRLHKSQRIIHRLRHRTQNIPLTVPCPGTTTGSLRQDNIRPAAQKLSAVVFEIFQPDESCRVRHSVHRCPRHNQ